MLTYAGGGGGQSPIFPPAVISRSKTRLVISCRCTSNDTEQVLLQVYLVATHTVTHKPILKRCHVPASQEGGAEEFVGCCACCWVGEEGKIGNGNRGQIGGQSCSGSCAKRCRLPDQNSKTSGNSQAAETGKYLPRHRGTEFPKVRNDATAPELPSWQVAHARLCRLIRAADADAAAAAAGGSSRSGGSSEHGPRPPGIARRHPHLLSFLAGMLRFDPDERLTPLQALAHPFFSEVLPFTMPEPRALGAIPKIAKLEGPAQAATVASSPGVSGMGSLGKNSTKARPCDGEVVIPVKKSWGDMIKLSSSLPRPLPTNGIPNQLRSTVGSIFQDSVSDSASVKPLPVATRNRPVVPSENTEISQDGNTSSSAISGMRGVRNAGSTQLARLADTAEAVARRSSVAVQVHYREGGCSNGASSNNKPTITRRPNRYLNAPHLPGVPLSPVRPETGSAPGVSIKVSTSKPEVPLRPVSDANPDCHRYGGGCRRDTSNAPEATVTQRDGQLNPSLLTEYGSRVSHPGQRTEGTKITLAPTTAPAATANPGRRPRNRFLTPATLATLNPDLRDKIAEAMASAEREDVTLTEIAASVKSPPKRVRVDKSHEEDKPSNPKRSKSTVPQEQREKSNNRKSPSKERQKQSRRSSRGQSTRGGRAWANNTANGPGRKGSTPRRAVVASGLALSRSRSEDSDSDCRGR